MRDRVVVITPRLPWPLDDGGRIAMWQTIWSVAQEFEVTLIALIANGDDAGPEPREFRELGIEVIRVSHRFPATSVAALRGLFGRWPYTLARYHNHVLAAKLQTIVRDRRPLFFLVNHLHMAPYIDFMGDVPMVLRQHNVESRWMARYAEGLLQGPRRWYAQIQARRLRRAEEELCSRAALVLSMQDEETAELRRLAPDAAVETLPAGVDPALYETPTPVTPPVVLIAGAFGWAPNADGAVRFLREGWRLAMQRDPGVRLRIAGKDPPPALVAEGKRRGAEVTGYIESMSAEFAKATMLLVPLWVGAGARIKIIEALTAGLPVVSTPLGAEGLGLRAGEDFLVGETPAELAERMSELLESPDRRQELAQRGRKLAAEKWSLKSLAARQNRLCRDACHATGT
jgi:polysaccharide biosynthesis protein PslH